MGDGLCYRSHLLGEPETTIDQWSLEFVFTNPQAQNRAPPQNPRLSALSFTAMDVGPQ